MQNNNEFIIKVYEDGNIRIPIKIRKALSINKGSNLIIKLDQNGSVHIDTINHQMDVLRTKIKSQLGNTETLVDNFLKFKKSDNSTF